QTAMFDSPIPIAADTDYMIAYRAPSGHYSLTLDAFSGAGVQRAPLYTAADSGAFSYPDAYPASATSTSYYVDVVFTRQATPVSLVAQSPGAGDVGVATSATVSVGLNVALASGAALSLSGPGGAVAGTSTLSADGLTLTFTPGAALAEDTTYTATATGLVSTEGATLADQTWSFTTATADGCPCGLFGELVPDTPAAADSAAVELGLSFVPDADGLVTGVRFYKGVGNGGTHTGTLWSATGTQLATVTFTGEGAAGWQTALFDTPVEVTADTTYVVSYYAPQGHYAITPAYFTTDLTVGHLTAPAAGNGRFVYGGGFPASTADAANYFVDVVYTDGAVAPSAASTSPSAGASGVATSVHPSARLSVVPTSATPVMTLTGPGGAVAGTSSFDTATATVSFTPSAALVDSSTYTTSVTLGGSAVTAGSWSFTTVVPSVVSRSPSAGASGVATSVHPSARLSVVPTSATPVMTLTGPGGAVAGTSSFDTATATVSFTPSSPLDYQASYGAEVRLGGATLSGGSWSFVTLAAPPPPTRYVQIVASPDVTGDRWSDAVTVDRAGRLSVFPGIGGGRIGSVGISGPGWADMRVYAPGDWDGDGWGDLVAVDPAGRLILYSGTSTGTFRSGRQIGNGWTTFRITPAGDVNGDGVADLLAIDSAQRLWLYPGAGGGRFGARLQVGNGWGGFDLYAGRDMNRDGRADILGIDSAGRLWFYAGIGGGRFAMRVQVGNGWNGYVLASGGDFNRDGIGDLLGRDSVGGLWFYAGRVNGGFAMKVKIASGW
ncbi:MAG: DUF4082 domain-containing protein, partial [Actinomycetales bacterium]|nr:DUF4082 domain-containing protein [Actinomycetales bacterium]